MEDDNIRQLLNKIGQLLADDTEYPIDGTLLIAKLAENYVAPSIFKDLGDHVLYRDPDLDRLGDALLELWGAYDREKRWAEIEYIVRGNQFEVAFTYADEIDSEEDPLDREDRIVATHFGKKPIVYPPMPDDDDDIFHLGSRKGKFTLRRKPAF